MSYFRTFKKKKGKTSLGIRPLKTTKLRVSIEPNQRSPAIFLLVRMKRKRKRSTSSSSSSSSRKSSASSSSSSRRRAKKKKKKKRKSARGSKRRSSRRRSDEEKRGRKRKEENEEDQEDEWHPAPPDTSATFLDQKTWEAFGAADEEEEEEAGEPSAKPKHANGPRICLYSLSPSSDEDDVCEWPSHPARETKESPGRRRQSRSTSSGREDGRTRSSERGTGDQRWTAEPQRSSVDERKRRISCSSSDSAYSRKLGPGKDFSGRNFSLRGGEDPTPSESDLGQGKAAKQQPGWSQSDAGQVRAEQEEEISVPEGRSKEDLPANLVDIFQQIAKFQKEKGIEPKKSTNSI